MSTTQRDQRRRAQRRNVSTPSVIRVELRDGMGNPRNITADLTDWSDTGNSELFVQLTEAFQTLSDPERRAAYDARHSAEKKLRWKIFDQAAVATGPDVEKRKRQGILALLYATTVKDPERGSLTVHAFEDMLGCPKEHLEAALWYLKGKGYVQRTDGGRYTLTVNGFEEAEERCVKPMQTAGEIASPANQ